MSLFTFNYFAEGSTGQPTSILDKTLPALLGVVIGFCLNRGYEYFKERKAIQRAGEQFINEIELFQTPLEQQVEAISVLIKKINDPNANDFILEGKIPLDTDRFQIIDRLQVYKYFERISNDHKETRKIVNKLYGILKVCSIESERLKSAFAQFNDERRNEVKNFNKAINHLLGDFSGLITSLEKVDKKPGDDPLVRELNPVFDKFTGVENMNINQIATEICSPLVHVTAKFRLDERTESFSTHNRECFTALREINSLNRSFVFLLQAIKGTLEKFLKELGSKLNECYKLKS